jgi:hypothetical protein
MKRVQQAILMPNREAVNAAQVSLLLNVAQSIVGCLRQPETELGKEQSPEIDGGARLAMEQTLAKACQRLDNILAEDTRWTFEAQQAMEKQLSQMYAQNTNLLRAQTMLAEEALRPHSRYHPRLIQINGVWCAVLGDINDIDNAICGIGETPQEALRAFDDVFTGQVPGHLVNWINAVYDARVAGKTPPLYKEFKNEQDKTNKLDDTGTGTITKTESPGSPPQGNRPEDGSNDDGRQPDGGPDGNNGPHRI